MKYLTLAWAMASILACSSIALACPELSGQFTCGFNASSGEPNQLKVLQNGKSFEITLFSSADPIKLTADEKSLELDNDEYYMTFLTSCEKHNNALSFQYSMIRKSDQSVTSSELIIRNLTVDESELTFVSHLQQKAVTHDSKTVFVCTRQ